MVRLITWLLAALLLPGCSSRQDAARELFTQGKTCPADRVRSSELGGPTLHDMRKQRQARSPPRAPDEVRADPTRFALWQQQQAETERRSKWIDDRFHLYRASGCGQQRDHAKGRPRGRCSVLWQALSD